MGRRFFSEGIVEFTNSLGIDVSEASEVSITSSNWNSQGPIGSETSILLTVISQGLGGRVSTDVYRLCDASGKPLGRGHPALLVLLRRMGIDPDQCESFSMRFEHKNLAKATVVVYLEDGWLDNPMRITAVKT